MEWKPLQNATRFDRALERCHQSVVSWPIWTTLVPLRLVMIRLDNFFFARECNEETTGNFCYGTVVRCFSRPLPHFRNRYRNANRSPVRSQIWISHLITTLAYGSGRLSCRSVQIFKTPNMGSQLPSKTSSDRLTK